MGLTAETTGAQGREVVLLFSRRDDLMASLSVAETRGREYLLIKAGEIFRQLGPRIYQIRPDCAEDYRRVVAPLDGQPLRVLFFWNYDASPLDYAYHGNPERLLMQIRRNRLTGVDAIACLREALQERREATPVWFFHHGVGLEVQPQNFLVADLRERDSLGIRSIHCATRESNPAALARLVIAELDGAPQEADVVPTDIHHVTERVSLPLTGDSVLLVADAGSGRGRDFAREIAEVTGARVVLLQDKGSSLAPAGHPRVQDIRCDFSQVSHMEEVIGEILRRHRGLAGVVCFVDASDPARSWTALDLVVLLDEFTQEQSLQVFLLHSTPSSSGAFTSAFAHLRDTLVRRKKRSGRTLSIQSALTADGLAVQALGGYDRQAPVASLAREQWKAGLGELLMRLAADVLKVSTESVSLDLALDLESHDGLHFNSILLIELSVRIEKRLGVKVTPVIFFECRTLRGLADYMLDRHPAEISSLAAPAAMAKTDEGPAWWGAAEWEALRQQARQKQDRAQPKPSDRPRLLASTGDILVRLAADVLKVSAESVSLDLALDLESHDGLHFNSILLIELAVRIEKRLGVKITPVIFFECRTLRGLVEYLLDRHSAEISTTSGSVQAVNKDDGPAWWGVAEWEALRQRSRRKQDALQPDASDRSGTLAGMGEILVRLAADVLKVSAESVSLDLALDLESHDGLHFNSILLIELAVRIEKRLGVKITPVIFFECQTLRGLAAYLVGQRTKKTAALPDADEARRRLSEQLTRVVADVHKVDVDSVPADLALDLESQEGLHFDSILLIELATRIEKRFGIRLTPVTFFQARTLVGLVDYLLANHGAQLNATAGLSAGVASESLTGGFPASWNATALEYPAAKGVHHLIEEQAIRNPEAVAVLIEGIEGPQTRITYAQLNCCADVLARRLVEEGVTPGTLVGILAKRSVEMVIGLVGIWKAGGAYVPLDSAFPVERLTYMVRDARLEYLVTLDASQDLLPSVYARRIVVEPWETTLRNAAGEPVARSRQLDPDQLAYVIYTSGSTGNPKGVMIPHRALCNFMLSMQRKPGFTAQDCLLAVTTISFDIAGLELFLPLVAGGCVDLVPDNVGKDGILLKDYLARSPANVLQATPATWQMLLAAGWKGKPGLKMLCGGDALSEQLAAALLDRGSELWNLYGPTETTVWSAIARIESPQAVHLGRPIGNTRLYILDENQQPSAVGFVGELCIGGDGLALGYLNQPELTRQKFLPDPFQGAPGAKMYRTGDAVRFGLDGRLRHLGRFDFQVKIRGFRVELGEIESAIRSTASVPEAVVVLRREDSGHEFLVAFVQQDASSGAADLSSVAERLRSRLPHYMLPSRYLALSSYPITLNGKIDRKTLSTAPVEEIVHRHGAQEVPGTGGEPIAIIGLAARMPQSDTAEEFWEHLLNGDDLVSEIPAQRWDWKAIGGSGRTGIRWGGFVNDVDCFDAPFFRISPAEAKLMDPQQRLLLETVWAAIEDAGYAPGALAHSNTGTYIGVATLDYLEILSRAGLQAEAYSSTGTHTAMIANRVSWFFNLLGPSLPVNTACSSSLVAIHQAVQALRRGECELAIAGGVNSLLTPSLYIAFDKAGMLSPDGRCKAFAEAADGYVRSEGVGVVLLKPLKRAIADGDSIHGVIRGTAENHGGRSNSLRAPSPQAQARVLERAYQDAGVDPSAVGYIECHGTGTALGDPIEVEGLKLAFASLYGRWRRTPGMSHCGLGSVKTNAGHLEAAAGMAGLIKVLYAMKRHELPASLHGEVANRFINLEGTPFHLVRERQRWERPRDESGRELPLRAGLSSFGFGGSNAHVVLEEYTGQASVTPQNGPFLIPLSARNPERLREVARRLLKYVARDRRNAEENLPRLAYTLQVGREAMDCRVAMLASSASDLEERLTAFLDGARAPDGVFPGAIQDHREVLDVLNGDEDMASIAETWLARGKHARLLKLWASGFEFDWNSLYPGAVPVRISLPTYPFARERHWVDESAAKLIAGTGGAKEEPASCLAPGSDATLLLRPVWIEAEASPTGPEAAQEAGHQDVAHAVVLCGFDGRVTESDIQERFPGSACIDVRSSREPLVDAVLSVFRSVKAAYRSDPSLRMVMQVVVDGVDAQAGYPALSGFLRSFHLETPGFRGQVVDVDAEATRDEILSHIAESRRFPWQDRVRGVGHRRLVQRWEEIEAPDAPEPLPWKENGIYLITGGAGGVGMLLAQHLGARVRGARLILTGRSELDTAQQSRLRRIACAGSGRIEYRRVDVTDATAMEILVRDVEQQFGAVSGILHCAGTLRDDVVVRKDEDSVRAVLAPKVAGTLALDRALQQRKLDFFALFSSVSVLGSSGQADYATANAFLDAFAHWRNQRVASGERHGHTVSINWPFWEEGGMRMDRVTQSVLYEEVGLAPLPTAAGLQALTRSLVAGAHQVLVMTGDGARLRRFLSGLGAPEPARRNERCPQPAIRPGAEEQVEQKLRLLIAKELELPAERIRPTELLTHYGLDSLGIARLNQQLRQIVGQIPKTLFYQYPRLRDLSGYLVREHSSAVMDWAGGIPSSSAGPAENWPASFEIVGEIAVQPATGVQEPIAIIGLAGRYPGADSPDAFWENLRAAKRSTGEIPARRWSLDDFYEPDPEKARSRGRSFTKWGGFLDGFADFDPLFFHIPPAEALSIDPQERWMLMACWEAMEDAGYCRKIFDQEYQGSVGVFIGATKLGFHLHPTVGCDSGETRLPVTSFSSMANRVSYHLNLRGPSIALDTMCSASLTALHEACEHVRRGDCRLAFAGAVNLNLHPRTYVDLCQSRMVTDEPETHCFAKDGRGFLPGEGVGAVLLKRLDEALRDGDAIYGVVRGTAVSHGGFTGGYTVPSLSAQRQLIESALRRSGCTSGDIDYVEAAANGSGMGDAIEFEALRSVFVGLRGERCPLGSVKPNIGHAEAASGMSQLTRVLQQMRHSVLAPTLVDSSRLDVSLRWEESPFRLVNLAESWPNAGEQPHRALITSFGAGGTNAAAVIEQHLSTAGEAHEAEGTRLIVLSARTEKQLRHTADRLHAALRTRDWPLDSVAYTLQTGREAMRFRAALVVDSGQELLERLGAGSFEIRDSDAAARLPRTDSREDVSEQISDALRSRHLLQLAELWLSGYDDIDWRRLYPESVRRCWLPAYPFEYRSLWHSDQSPTAGPSEVTASVAVRPHIEAVIRDLLFLQESDEIDGDATFVDIGLDSISGVRFIRTLSRRLGIPIADTAIFEHPTISALARSLTPANGHLPVVATPLQNLAVPEGRLRSLLRQHPEVVPLGLEGDGPILVCIHPMSGDVGLYSRLAEAARGRFRVLGIRAQGFLTSSAVLTNVEDMARHVVGILGVLEELGPVHLFAVSMGGVVAYECVRQFQLQGQKIASLWLAEAPLIESAEDALLWTSDETQNLIMNANFLVISMLHLDEEFRKRKAAGAVRWPDVEIQAEEVGDVSGNRLVERLVDLIKRRGVRRRGEELAPRLQSMARVHLANLQSFQQYRAKPLPKPAGTPAILLRTQSAAATSPEVYNPDYLVNVQRAKGSLLPFFKAWKKMLPELETRMVGGDSHFDLLGKAAVVEEIAEELARSLNEEASARVRTVPATNETIAVVGMSGRFPGGETLDEFWRLLKEGRSAIGEFPTNRQWRDYPDSLYVRRGGFLGNIDQFDPVFFQISPKEAELMDPSERLFLEESWRAIEDAGVDPGSISGQSWGVFCGGGGDYTLLLRDHAGISPHVTASGIPGRVSYTLNLHGPCSAVDVGCASSLLAVAQACDALLRGQCEVALAGGVLTYSTPNLMAVGCQSGTLSPTGRARAFDEQADGMMPAEAVGVLVMKPLSKALAEGDRIHAVLEAWGNNHNGKTNGISAPSATAERKLFTETYRRFGVDPGTITLIEPNATGTPLGDRMEVEALTGAFRTFTSRRGFCALGSAENNIGHAFQASGMAHLFKVLLAFRHRELPPTIGVENENRAFDLDNSPFYINRSAQPWVVESSDVRRAAVSSFGATGANLHLVLSEAPEAGRERYSPGVARPVLIAISAHTEQALRSRAENLAEALATGEVLAGLEAISANLLMRRSHLPHRAAFLANSYAEVVDGLRRLAGGGTPARGYQDTARVTTEIALGAFARFTAESLTDGRGAAEDHLLVLADLYTKGVPIDLSRHFSADDKRPITLPAYPFDRRRCWLGDAPAAGLKGGLPARAAPQQDSTLQTVRALLIEITGHREDEIEDSASLSRLGLDSLMSMRLLALIKERFDRELHLVDLLTFNTVEQLASLIGTGGHDPETGREEAVPVTWPASAPREAEWFRARLSAWSEGLQLVRVRRGKHSAANGLPPAASGRIRHELLRQRIALFHAGEDCFLAADGRTDLSSARDAISAGQWEGLLADLPAGTLLAPVSTEQERSLYHSEVLRHASWNIQHAYELAEPDLDLDRLRRAFSGMAEKYDLLRTRFFGAGDSWGQQIVPLASVTIELVQADNLGEYRRWVASQRNRLLDVSEGPLIQCSVCCVDRRWYLGFVAHHAAADAFTPTMLLTGLMEEYHGLATRSLASEVRQEQYWQYALRTFTTSETTENSRYWDEVWSGQPAAMQLPYAAKPEQQSVEQLQAADVDVISLPLELTSTIAEFAREHDVTVTQLFTAAVSILLVHGMGNAKAVVHFVHNRRDRASLISTPGEFSNVLLVPLHADSDTTLLDTCRSVQRTLLNSLRHSRLSFSSILAYAGLGGYEEYFQQTGDVMVDSADIDAATLAGSFHHGRSLFSETLLAGLEAPTALATLFFQILRVDQQLHLISSWRKSLFDGAEMRSLSALLVRVAEEIVRDPRQKVAALLIRLQGPLHALRKQSRRYLSQPKPAIRQVVTEDASSEFRIDSRPGERAEAFPLTDIQESFLIGRELGTLEERVGCHMYFELEMSEVDIHRLNRSWQHLIDRHEMLRAVVQPNGQQRILQEIPAFTFKVKDLRRRSAEEQAAAVQATREKLSHKVYESDCWPLFDIQISLCSDRKVIHFSIDELIADASGAEMLLEEWQYFYDHPDAELPPLALSFRDYVLAVRRFESTKRCREDLDYWVTRLGNLPGGPSLPRHTSECAAVHRFVRLSDRLSAGQWQSVRRNAESWGISPSTLLLGLFAEVLAVGSGPNPFSMILTLYNRPAAYPELARVLGPFISTTIFVADGNGSESFVGRVRGIHQRLWEGLDHSSVSGVRVLRALRNDGRIGPDFAIPVAFNSVLRNKRNDDPENFYNKVTFNLTQTPQVRLDHQAYERNGELHFNWDVMQGYFAPGVIEALFTEYCRMLRELSHASGAGEEWTPKIAFASPSERDTGVALLDGLSVVASPQDRFLPFPLTDQQQAYAFGRSAFGSQTSSQVCVSVDAEDLDVPRLRRAWGQVLAKHDMLSAVIRPEGGQQIRRDTPEYAVTLSDLRGKSEVEFRSALQATERRMISRLCPLGGWPSFELCVSRMDERRFRIHFGVDMIIADARSLDILLKDLFFFYEHPDSVAEPLPVTFRDYVLALKEYKSTEGHRLSAGYWDERFRSMPPGPDLPTLAASSGETYRLESVLGDWSRLRRWATDRGVSPSIILLTAYADVLAAWSARRPFTIVVPRWERLAVHARIDEVVGDFTSMNWLVVDDAAGSFGERVMENHRALQRDFEHRAVNGLSSFRRQAMKNGNMGELRFPVVFTHMAELPVWDLPRGFQRGESLSKTSGVDLDNLSLESGDSLSLCWDVAQGRYSHGMIEEMFGAYCGVLAGLSEDPDRCAEKWQHAIRAGGAHRAGSGSRL